MWHRCAIANWRLRRGWCCAVVSCTVYVGVGRCLGSTVATTENALHLTASNLVSRCRDIRNRHRQQAMPTTPRAGRAGHTKPNYSAAWNLSRLRRDAQRQTHASKTRAVQQTLDERAACLLHVHSVERFIYPARSTVRIDAESRTSVRRRSFKARVVSSKLTFSCEFEIHRMLACHSAWPSSLIAPS